MELLKESFKQLCQQMTAGRGLSNSGEDPVYYLVIHPDMALEAKGQEKAWQSQLRNMGWQVEKLSMASAVQEILISHPLRKIWLSSPSDQSFDSDSIREVNETVAAALCENDRLANLILDRLKTFTGKTKTVLMLTDLEALHPYLRVGVLEQKIQGRVPIPVIILYPGKRMSDSLSFLGIYPYDGNYRSMIFGG